MIKRGPIVAISGIVMILISVYVAATIVPSNVTGTGNLSMSDLFEGMFNEISNEIEIMPNDTAFFSYSTLSSNVPLIWGIQIIDFEPGDELSIKISNIFGDEYGEFVQDEPILFELLQIPKSDTLNFEITNLSSDSQIIVMMFSEDPENSAALTDINSPVMNTILPLVISGFLLILGIIVSVIGSIVILVDLKNNQNNKRNY